MFQIFKTCSLVKHTRRYFDECCSKTIFVHTMKVTGVQNNAIVHRYFDTLIFFFQCFLMFLCLSIYPSFIIYSNNTKNKLVTIYFVFV